MKVTQGHSIFSLHELQKGCGSRLGHTPWSQGYIIGTQWKICMGQKKSGSPQVSFFLLRQALLVYRLPPLDYTEYPAIPSASQHAWLYPAGPWDQHGSLCLFPIKMSPILKLLYVDWVKWLEEPSISYIFDKSKSWVCWPKDIGPLACPTWESPPNFPFSGYDFGLRNLLILANSQVITVI